MKYYFLDWIIAALVLASVYLTAHHKRQGFLLGALAALFGIVFSVMIQSWANGICSAAIVAVNMWGWSKWRNNERL